MSDNKCPVFVIMPFAKEFLPGYVDLIKPAIEEAGMEAIRADQDPQGNIHTMMFDRIFNSPIIVADLSGANPNVFYELGVSHCMGCKTITIAREDSLDKVPFDIAPYRVLIYPKPPKEDNEKDNDMYKNRINECIENLKDELLRIQNDSKGIPNPIQDYQSKRSPLTSSESLYLPSFEAKYEEKMLDLTEEEFSYVAVGGSDFTRLLTSYVESGKRKKPLKIRIYLLDLEFKEGWEFLYSLIGDAKSGITFEDYFLMNKMKSNDTVLTVNYLKKYELFSFEIVYYKTIPMIWAYIIDNKRIILGYMSINRLISRDLPVSIIVKNDHRTKALFSYYMDVIKSLGSETIN